MTTVVTFGNFKGGVGKTTSACMTSILLASEGYNTLHIDFDPQADSTDFLVNVYDYNLEENYTSLYDSLSKERSFKRAIISITEGLDLLPSGSDLVGYEKFAREITGDKEGVEHFVLDAFLSEVKEDYNFVVIDVPPTLNVYNSNALLASDYSVVVMKTQRKSLNATRKYLNFIEDINRVREQFDYQPLLVAGVLPYLVKKHSPLDNEIITSAIEEFGSLVLEHHILERERVKRYDEEGISFKKMDVHDKDVFNMYQNIVDELLENMEGRVSNE